MYSWLKLIIYIFCLTPCYILKHDCSRQGPYWQIAYPSFWVAWNGKKNRCTNTVFYGYLRKLSLILNIAQY